MCYACQMHKPLKTKYDRGDFCEEIGMYTQSKADLGKIEEKSGKDQEVHETLQCCGKARINTKMMWKWDDLYV